MSGRKNNTRSPRGSGRTNTTDETTRTVRIQPEYHAPIQQAYTLPAGMEYNAKVYEFKMANEHKLGNIGLTHWRYLFNNYLDSRGWADVLTPNFVPPRVDNGAVESNEVKLNRRLDAIVKSCIIDNTVGAINFLGCKTAYELMERIKIDWRGRDESYKIKVRRELISMSINDGETNAEFAIRHRNKYEECIIAGVTLTDADARDSLIGAMTTIMNNTKTHFRLQTQTQPELATYTLLQSAIAEDDLAQVKHSSGRAQPAAAFVASSAPRYPGAQQRGHHCTKETGCTEIGHTKDKCFAFHPELLEAYRKHRAQNKKITRGIKKPAGATLGRTPSNSGKRSVTVVKGQPKIGAHMVYIPAASPSESANEPRIEVAGMVLSKNMATVQQGDMPWHLDTGASKSLTTDRKNISGYHEITPVPIVSASGAELIAVGKGIAMVGGLALEVLYVPKLTHNLLSVTQMSRVPGSKFVIENNEAHFTAPGIHIIGKPNPANDLYAVPVEPPVTDFAFVTSTHPDVASMELWHRRMSHTGLNAIRTLAKLPNTGIKVSDPHTDFGIYCCEACVKAKHVREGQPIAPARRSSRKLELVHSDLAGPILGQDGLDVSTQDFKYIISFIDDYSRYMWIYPLRSKTSAEILGVFNNWMQRVERESGCKLLMLRTDGGSEYSSVMAARLSELGIARQITTPHTPMQNGVAERANRTIFEGVRANLVGQRVDKRWWVRLQSIPYGVEIGCRPEPIRLRHRTFVGTVWMRISATHEYSVPRCT